MSSRELITEVAKSLRGEENQKSIEYLLKDILRRPEVTKAIMYDANITSKEILDNYIEATINFSKEVTDNDISATLTVDINILDESLKKVLSKLSLDSLDILNLRGSPSVKELALDLVESKLLGKPKKLKGSKSKAKVKPLRSTKGKFISLVNIRNLINELLSETIADNMIRPNLKHRTGRFANSVKLVDIKQRGDMLQAYLTYMKYPYQTFEPGYAQGFRGYDPRRLIDKSVREIASKIVKTRLQTVVV